jgi:3-deoxy-D-manno-octulosonic-acid transferase
VPYLLNLIYLLLILISLPWLVVQAVRKGKYREGYAAKFLGLVPHRVSDKKCLWLHAVSVGEVNLLAPLLKMIQEKQPDWECVISTTTTTGMALAKKKYAKYAVFYCPLDFSWAAAAAMRRIRPDVLVLAELELWPNLIRAAKRRGARVAVVNGRLSEHSYKGYRRIRPMIARLMRQIDLVAVQDETYAERFRDLGSPSETVHVTGSIKYDGAQTDRKNPTTRRLAALAGFDENDIVLLGGSTQDPEEAMLLETFHALSPAHPRLRLVLVPRHPDRFDAVAKLLDGSGLSWQRRTKLEETQSSSSSPAQPSTPNSGCSSPSSDASARHPRILLVDGVGELGAWWGTAHIAFVGGSMGNRGGQNMIEPAAYGAAVSFGPNTWNFRDIVVAMLDRNAAVVVEDSEPFAAFVRRCLEQPEYATALGERAQTFVLSQLGATERTATLLTRLVENR